MKWQIFLSAGVLLPNLAWSEDMPIQLGAHEHGTTTLNLALDGNTLQVELLSPAINLVGFEHQPRSDEEREKVLRVRDQLESVTAVLVLPVAANCHQDSATVESGLLAAARSEDGHHVDHDEDHDHDHDHDKDHDHDHAKDHDHDHGDSHAEFSADYTLTCQNPSAIGSLEISLFQSFSGVERIKGAWLNESGQGAVDLTADNPTLRW